MRNLYLLVVLILLISCDNAGVSGTDEANSELSSQITFGRRDYKLPPVSSEVSGFIRQWQSLEDFLNEAGEINGSSHTQLRNRSESMLRYSDSLMQNIPEVFETKIVQSRLLVLQTRAELLYQTVHATAVDSAAIQNEVSEMNTAIANLFLQLDEKIAKDAIDSRRMKDEEEEYRKQQNSRDSIFSLELKDRNR